MAYVTLSDSVSIISTLLTILNNNIQCSEVARLRTFIWLGRSFSHANVLCHHREDIYEHVHAAVNAASIGCAQYEGDCEV